MNSKPLSRLQTSFVRSACALPFWMSLFPVSAFAQGGGPSYSDPGSPYFFLEVYFYIVLFAASAFAGVAVVLFIGAPLSQIVRNLVNTSVSDSLTRLILAGVFVSGMLAGVGFPERARSATGYPSSRVLNGESIDWLLHAYRAFASSMTVMMSVMGVILFTMLVLHASIERAKLDARR